MRFWGSLSARGSPGQGDTGTLLPAPGLGKGRGEAHLLLLLQGLGTGLGEGGFCQESCPEDLRADPVNRARTCGAFPGQTAHPVPHLPFVRRKTRGAEENGQRSEKNAKRH